MIRQSERIQIYSHSSQTPLTDCLWYIYYTGWAKSRYTVIKIFFICFEVACSALYVIVEYHKHLEMLREVIVPQLQTKSNFDEFFFQQDGASPHYALRVRDYLNKVFPQRWFGRRGSIEWPPRSTDLTQMNFFFLGVVNNKMYDKNLKTVNELQNYSHDAFREIDKNLNLRRTVCQSV